MKKSKIHKDFYDDLQASIIEIESKFFEEKIGKIRNRDLERFKEYRVCLDGVEIKEGKVLGMKNCMKKLKNSKSDMLQKVKLEKIKTDMYDCVNKEYKEKSYTLLAKVGFQDCLKKFENDVKGLM